jgi:hypothetical protein
VKYDSAVWAHRLNVKCYSKYVDQIHQMMVVCYSRLYRTVLYLPATAMSGWLLLKYGVAIRAVRYAMKKRIQLPGKTLVKIPLGQQLLY